MALQKEEATVGDVLSQLQGHRADFQIFCTQVLGAPEEDRPNGRLPLLEARSADHEKRIVRVERVILMLIGAAGLLKALAWGADSVAHVVRILHGG